MAVSKSKKVTKSNKKGNSKIRKFFSIFDFSTKRGAMLTYAVAFAIVGGGYMAYTTFAATAPGDSYNFRWLRVRSAIKATDGKIGDLHCLSNSGNTGAYGKATQCIQFNSTKKAARPGIYFISSGIFASPWKDFFPTKYSPAPGDVPDGQLEYVKCSNMERYFAGPYYAISTYGTARFGHIFYNSNGVWKIKFANYNTSDGKCTTSSEWYTASPW